MTAPLRVLATGSRGLTDDQLVADVFLEVWHDAVQDGWPGIHVDHGGCPTGMDEITDRWCRANGVSVKAHPADWDHCGPECPPRPHRVRRKPGDVLHPGTLDDYCPGAGPRRNASMVALRPGLVVAAPMGASRGTRNCIRRAEAAGIPVRHWEQP